MNQYIYSKFKIKLILIQLNIQESKKINKINSTNSFFIIREANSSVEYLKPSVVNLNLNFISLNYQTPTQHAI